MIEKYFILGVRLKWTLPGDYANGQDGAIIDNPQKSHSRMVYDGLDGHLYNLSEPHVSTVRLTMRMNIPYTWLAYYAGRTTKMPLTGDVLTGLMSGCIIASWRENGKRYVGHIGTEANETVNQRVKAKFGWAMPDNTAGFNPYAAWPIGEIKSLLGRVKQNAIPGVVALVTANNQYYSVLMFKLSANEWCVGGCKKVAPMNYQALKTKFLPRGSLSNGKAFGGAKFIK